MKECHNCYEDMSSDNIGMDGGYYRDWQGNKYDASLFPICKACVSAGKMEQEGDRKRLYLGPSRSYELKREAEDRLWRNFGYGSK
jgi:hypothetical protein